MGRRKKVTTEFAEDPKEQAQSGGPIFAGDDEEGVQSKAGEQLDLIDVTPENLKKILPVAKAYRKIVKERVGLTNKETELKNKLLGMIKEANMRRLSDGKIRFKHDGLIITVTPCDEKISIKEERGDGESE